MADTPEGKVKKKIKKVVEQYGVYTPTYQAGYGKNGTSDSLNCVCGQYVAVEAKATLNDKPTALQRVYLRKVVEEGGYAFVIDADNLFLLEPILTALHGHPADCVRYRVSADWRLLSVELQEPAALRKLVGNLPSDFAEKKKQ